MCMKYPCKIFVLFLFLAVIIPGTSGGLRAQEPTKVMGLVRDARTGEPLPYVNIYFKGTTVGATSSFEGTYSLESRKSNDTVVASYVGYFTVEKPVQLNHFQEINFDLQPENYELSEVVIVAGENPAEILLRKILDCKDANDPDKVPFYQAEAYTKMQFDINNISEKFMNRRILKPFRFVFDHMDTSSVNGKAYLPVMLSESFSDIYFRYSPRDRKEIIKATRISGIENASMSQFVGNLAQDVNIYNNYINLFQKNFPSPVSSLGLLYYKYYLVDSTTIDGCWCYNIMFKPRRTQENAFTGNLWVNDTSFAVKKLEMRIGKDANINFINDLVIAQEFDKVNKVRWMMTREQMLADFNLVDEAKTVQGFFGSRTVLFSNYRFAPARDEKIYSVPNNIQVLEDANRKTDEFWTKSRPEQLSHREESVYRLADTLKRLPVFNTYMDIAELMFTGYWVNGKFEWGPYASTYSYNLQEGHRFRIGGRTSNDFSTRVMFDGYLAYGTTDHTPKYKAGLVYMLNKLPDRVVNASFRYDMEQLGMSSNAFREDFFFNSFFRRNPQDKLSMVKEIRAGYKHEWFTGFSNSLNLVNRKLFAIGGTGISLFDPVTDGYVKRDHIGTTELVLDLHYGYREKVLAGEFERTIVSSPYPVLDFQYVYGIPGFLGGDFEYHKAQFRITQWFSWMSAGWTKYAVEAGKTWGKVPFPLMKIQPGNETFWYDEYAFNLMNYYEFVSDEYVNFILTHHFEGFFLNRIPLIRKLKWRETAQVRGALGRTGDQNTGFNQLPAGTYMLNSAKPYLEAGVGIENIFRFIRIDGFWRLSYNDHPGTNRFGMLVSAYFDF